MKKVSMFLMGLFALLLASQSAKAQEVTITLLPGYTWISYPGTDTLDFATAMGSFTPVQGDIIQSQWGNAQYRNGRWQGSVTNFYPGYGYKYKSTRQVPVSVTFHAQQTTPQVVVTTDAPQLITGNSAMGGGEVTTNDGTYILVRGLCWATHENPTTNDDNFLEEGSGVGSFSATMTGLNWSTTYYYRAYAVTPSGTVYGEQQSFTTRDGIPTLTTTDITNITAISATSGGNITDNGGLNITARGVCWSTSPNPTVSDSHTTNGTGTGSFTSSITGLEISTTYYVRAYATTNAGTAYGNELTFTTRDGIPTVTTAEVTNILCHSATCGGTVTDNCGLTITARGICWSTNHNPTINDNYALDEEEWVEKYYCELCSFTNIMTELALNTTYYVRAYATTVSGTGYGEEVSFTTPSSSVGQYVDLELPSGTLWGICNVGADSPEEYGDYFAWGETQPKDTYSWSTYQHCNGSYSTLTKYCNNSSWGYNGFTDNLTTLLPEDDAATANWGSDWRMPTKEEWQELYQNTAHTWTTQNGVYGRLFTASNGNSLFLPAAGCYRWGGELDNAGSDGYYWSSSLEPEFNAWGGDMASWIFFISRSHFFISLEERISGQSVRSVRCKNSIINVTANPSDCGLVSGGGSYMDHTSCTVFATANEGYAFTWWSEDGEVVSTDASYSFVVNGNRNLMANFVATGEHSYVDLGLPSGTLWATCNVGADVPEEYGDYFAWGETLPKDYYEWSNYQHCNGTETTLTKYITEPDYSYDFEIVDYLTTLLPEDDAATANWGADWRVPTVEEWEELLENTTYSWTFLNGVYGRIFTASNGNSIFLPATDYFYDEEYGYEWGDGLYMSSSLVTDEPFTAWNLFLNVIDLDTGEDFIVDTREGYRCNAHSVRAVRSVSSNNVPTGAIDGKFTINEVGDQVYFSQGNLQYIGSASTPYWKFANNQWDCLGDNGQGSAIQTVDRDMFGWGTSGYNHGAICYQPWSTSQTSSDYYAYGNSTYNLFDQTGQADWGYNPISNGGNVPNAWRTLTQPEWSYIFNTRATASGIRYAKAQVNGVNGVILLPDDWSPSTYNLNNVNTSSASFSSNTIIVSQWTTFENAGAVFLPAAGNRNGTEVINIDAKGFYWTASSNGSSNARNVIINESSLSSNDSSGRRNGLSVRLVRAAE